MSELLEIRQQIDVATQRVRDLEHSLVEHPDFPSIAANLASAARILKKLQQQFMEASARLGLEVCRYRAFDEMNDTKTAPAFGAIADFQRLVSVVYGAKKHGMKQRATVPEYVAQETLFGFGFAFAGSIGVVLTVRSDTNLFKDSYLNESFDTVFQMAKAANASEIKAFARELGPGPINALYRWAESNSNGRLGADIAWMHGATVRNSLFVQRQELWKLTRTIEKLSSRKEQKVTIEGVLQAADASKLRFKLHALTDCLKSGTVAESVIDEQHTVGLPRRYIATMMKIVNLQFSTGQERIRYHLLKLEPVSRRKGQ